MRTMIVARLWLVCIASLGAVLSTAAAAAPRSELDCRGLSLEHCMKNFHKCQVDLAWPKRKPQRCISKAEAQTYADRLVVPGLHEKWPIPGSQPGTNEELLTVTEGMFEESFLKVLEEEADILADLAEQWTALPKSKRVTFWMRTDDPARHAPRFAVEKAVLLVKQTLFPNGEDRELGIVGAKYWIQRRSRTDRVGFHYDKDEAMASMQQIMKFPIFGTINYLKADQGAPTVLYKQTVVSNGNIEVPRVPTTTWVVQPKRNRHVVQRGDLHHGADPALSAAPVPDGEFRYTLVITWWDYTPLEPNAHRLSDSELPPGLVKDVSLLGGLSPHRRKSSFQQVHVGRNNTDRRVRIETSRTHEAVAIDVPVMEAGGAYELHHVGGGVGGKVRVLPHGSRLDWAREMGNGKAHVVVVYDNPAHESRATMLAERVARRVLNPISTAFEFTVADASTAQQFFGFLKSPSQRFPVAIMASAGHGGVFVTEGKVC
eukprot:INCI3627.11.p1 GENE.INCI3627.11~~INCI3627.11.p1  ORF type:complete len:487 (+),score=71.87 INCI3627.11:401-1861(+)